MVGLGDEDFFRCLSPSSYLCSSVVSTAGTGAPPAAPSPTCVSYMDMPVPPYHHTLSFTGQEQYDCHGNAPFGLLYNGGHHAIPVVIPQKSSPTTESSSSLSSMSSSPPATSISSTVPQAFKKKGARCGDQRKAAPTAATNKKPRVKKEKLGERIIALQQLVSPFGKSDTATVLHEALGYIRFLHDQVQVLSSPYMQRLPPASAHATVQESVATGTVREREPPQPSDLRSRGLCLVPISCTDHVAGDGHDNGADLWSVAVQAGVTAAAGSKGAAALLPGGHPGNLA